MGPCFVKDAPSPPLLPERALRHGVPGVGVSTLASQWYCELKVDLEFRHPGVSAVTPAMEEGIAGHEALSAGAVPLSREELDQRLLAGRDVDLQESPFAASIHDAAVVGVPDLVRLRGRDARLVLEFKFSKHDALFMDRFVQAEAYALLLRQSGFGTDGTVCVVGILPPSAAGEDDGSRIDALRRGGVLEKLLERSDGMADRFARSPRSRFSLHSWEKSGALHAFRFEAATAERHLRWALDYWKQRREAVATRNSSKCRVCPFNAARLCPQARVRPQEAP
jgi:hypothetical protein